jgi:hypothetical protein
MQEKRPLELFCLAAAGVLLLYHVVTAFAFAAALALVLTAAPFVVSHSFPLATT